MVVQRMCALTLVWSIASIWTPLFGERSASFGETPLKDHQKTKLVFQDPSEVIGMYEQQGSNFVFVLQVS